MFRELTRKKNKLSEDECRDILIKEKRGVLSVLGDEGYPYGMPMNHYYNEEDGNIYFHSGKQGHRPDCLKKNDKVSFCVYTKGEKQEGEWALTVKSVIAFGKVEVIDDSDEIVRIATALSRKFTDDEGYIENEIRLYADKTDLLKMNVEHMCGKRVKEC